MQSVFSFCNSFNDFTNNEVILIKMYFSWFSGVLKDIDEYFGKQREWCTEYNKAAKETSQVHLSDL